jgi:hypothetical protein
MNLRVFFSDIRGFKADKSVCTGITGTETRQLTKPKLNIAQGDASSGQLILCSRKMDGIILGLRQTTS